MQSKQCRSRLDWRNSLVRIYMVYNSTKYFKKRLHKKQNFRPKQAWNKMFEILGHLTYQVLQQWSRYWLWDENSLSYRTSFLKEEFFMHISPRAFSWMFHYFNNSSINLQWPICSGCFCSLALKMPRKPAYENVICLCCLLNILANFSNLFLHTGKQCGPWSDCS